jgi:hypothetical protein
MQELAIRNLRRFLAAAVMVGATLPAAQAQPVALGASFDPTLRLVFSVEGGRTSKVTLMQGGGVFQGVQK